MNQKVIGEMKKEVDQKKIGESLRIVEDVNVKIVLK